MPVKDRTFSSSDIVRLWCQSLTRAEQREVVIFFLFIYPALIVTDTELDEIVEYLVPFVRGRAMRRLLTYTRQFFPWMRRFLLRSTVNMVFNAKMSRVVTDCINNRLSN